MIFYFSGTGNSKYIAEKLAKKYDDTLINMAENVKKKHSYTVKKGEKIGFVFPVYFYSVNDLVSTFIENLDIEGINGNYVYAVVTCGASIGGCGALLKDMLKMRNIDLSAAYPMVMPDNAMIYYNIKNDEENKKILQTADERLENIINQIDKSSITKLGSKFISKILLKTYHMSLSTKKFKVEDKCISCGKCEKDCPVKAIELKDGKPVWKKDKCIKCLSCINKCPTCAIQYGKFTKNRNRYKGI